MPAPTHSVLLAPNIYIQKADYKSVPISKAVKLLENQGVGNWWEAKSICEIVPADAPVHPFGDIDVKAKTKETLPKMDWEKERAYIAQHFEVNAEDVVMCAKPPRLDNQVWKVGAHWNVKSKMMENKEAVGRFINSKSFPAYYDREVYNGGERKFIQVGQGKTDGVVFQKLSQPNGDLPKTEDFLLTYMKGDEVEIVAPKKEEPLVKKVEPKAIIHDDEIQCLLNCISADCERSQWFSVLCAVKGVLGDTDEAYEMADEWSMTSPKYDPRDFPRQWRSIKENNFTKATLIKFAKDDNVEDNFNKWVEKYGTKKDDYYFMKQEFEKRVFKIENPVAYYQFKSNGEYTITTASKIRESYCDRFFIKKGKDGKDTEVSFIEEWIRDSTKRHYEYVRFDPTMTTPRHVYNSFVGFRAAQLPKPTVAKSTEVIKNHFKLLFGEHDEYALKWVAQILQHPNKKPCVCLILQSSKEGAGKSILVNYIGKKILGERYYRSVSDPASDLFSKHGNGVNERILIGLEEAEGKGFCTYMNKFKELITGDKYRLEPKGVDSYEVPNYVSFIALTNNDNPIPISANDRRFAAFNCDHDKIGDVAYFKQLAEAMEDDEVAAAFYEELMTIKIDIDNFQKARPETDYYKELKRTNIPSYAKYLSKRCDDMLQNDSPCYISHYTGAALYDDYSTFCTRCKYEPLKNTGFALKIKKVEGMDKTKSMGVMKYCFQWETIKDWLIREKIYDEDVF